MNTYIHKVHYYETDRMGITHHSNYIRWMEEARVNFLDQAGWGFDRMEADGIVSPITHVDCDFKKTTTFQDVVEIQVRIEEYNGVRMTIGYEMYCRGELAAVGHSGHCFLDRSGIPIRMKKQFPQLDQLFREMTEGRTSKDGYAIVFDPYEDDNVPGLKLEILTANEVFTSHEHGDHNAREKVKLVKAYGETPFQVTHLESFHDDCQGKKRGTNCITILESEGLRIAHLGDIGCMPTEEQKRALSHLDAVFAPAGGFYTMEPDQIRVLLEELSPKMIIPMHYRSERFGYDVIGTLDAFLHKEDPVVTYESNELMIRPDMVRQIAVLTCPVKTA